MKPYPKYKDSGIEWIGEVPEHWILSQLGFKARMIVPMRDKPIRFDGKVPWIRIEDLDGKYIDDSKSGQRVSDEIISEMNLKVFPEGSVLCSCSCNMGVTAIVKKPLISNQTFIGIVPSPELTSEFLYYAMQSNAARLQYLGSGAIQQYLSRENFEKLEVIFPPLLEQTSIATYLDRKTQKIDTLIDKKQKMIELLKEYRTAVINHAVAKGLNPKVKIKYSGIEWLGEIPGHWDTVSLKRIANIKYGLGQPPKEMENGLPLIRATNVIKGRITIDNLLFVDPEDIPYERDPVLRENDIIVVRSGAYTGDSAIIPKEFDGAITGYDMTVRVNSANPHFVAYCILSHYVLDYQINPSSLRAAQPHLNAEELGAVQILLPPREEQDLIVNLLLQEDTAIEIGIHKEEASIELLKEYRTALISNAVTGKIDVRGYDF